MGHNKKKGEHNFSPENSFYIAKVFFCPFNLFVCEHWDAEILNLIVGIKACSCFEVVGEIKSLHGWQMPTFVCVESHDMALRL